MADDWVVVDDGVVAELGFELLEHAASASSANAAVPINRKDNERIDTSQWWYFRMLGVRRTASQGRAARSSRTRPDGRRPTVNRRQNLRTKFGNLATQDDGWWMLNP